MYKIENGIGVKRSENVRVPMGRVLAPALFHQTPEDRVTVAGNLQAGVGHQGRHYLSDLDARPRPPARHHLPVMTTQRERRMQ
jgi:hypothetical protein